MGLIKNEDKKSYEKTSLNYVFYGSTKEELPKELKKVIDEFVNHMKEIESKDNNNRLSSDAVLEKLCKGLEKKYHVEETKKKQLRIKLTDNEEKIIEDKEPLKEFSVDAIHENIDSSDEDKGKDIIIEIEAGRAVSNYQFLKDIMECAMIASKKKIIYNGKPAKISNDGLYLVLAVRNEYKVESQKNPSKNYETIKKWLNAIAVSKLDLKLKGILLIGY